MVSCPGPACLRTFAVRLECRRTRGGNRDPGDPGLEFVNRSEVVELLGAYGYTEVPGGEERLHLSMPDQDGVVHLHLTGGDNEIEPRSGAKVIPTSTDSRTRG